MDAFAEAFQRTVGVEGGYSNDHDDRGGETMFGITVAVARANGYTGDMRNMPLGVAQDIYRQQYWNLLYLDDVAAISRPIAGELFDTAVNSGVATAGRYLQRAVNAFNRGGADYPDVTVDGIVGPMTVAALRSFIALRGYEGDKVMLVALNSLQGEGYIELTERRETDEKFVYGWFRNRVAA